MGERIPPLALQTLTAAATAITQPFTIRVHAGIARKPWARLWYLARGFDFSGRGYVTLSADLACQLLAVSRSTLYEWMRIGRRDGAFRRYKFRQNRLSVWLGGLKQVCKSLQLTSWGATAVVPLLDVNRQLRAIATAIVTHDLQSKSHYAARKSLKPTERKIYTPPAAEAVLAESKQSSQKPGVGQNAFVLHVGKRLAFVSKAFVPYGASQEAIGYELGISEWTVRRHHRQLAIERRQLVQAKAAYGYIRAGMEWETDRCLGERGIWSKRRGDEFRLFEPNGVSSSRRLGGHNLHPGRFLQAFGKTWLYRCNLYAVGHYKLCSMKAARKSLRIYLDHFATSTAGGEAYGDFTTSQHPPGKAEQNP